MNTVSGRLEMCEDIVFQYKSLLISLQKILFHVSLETLRYATLITMIGNNTDYP